jgi:hypothetical protein
MGLRKTGIFLDRLSEVPPGGLKFVRAYVPG